MNYCQRDKIMVCLEELIVIAQNELDKYKRQVETFNAIHQEEIGRDQTIEEELSRLMVLRDGIEMYLQDCIDSIKYRYFVDTDKIRDFYKNRGENKYIPRCRTELNGLQK
jgi:hypothetical protein